MIEKTTLNNFYNNIDNNLKNDCCVYIIQEKIEADYGFSKDINLEFCNKNDIKTYNLHRDGGCIVYFPGNIAWVLTESNRMKNYRFKNIDFIHDLTLYLKNKNINAVQAGNDLLVDGFKVASGFGNNIAPDYTRTFCGVQIAINADVDTIKNICKKEMVKIPKSLSDYGITTTEIENFILNWFK